MSVVAQRIPSPAEPVSPVIPPKAATFDSQLVKAFQGMESVVNDCFYASEMLNSTMERHFGTSKASDGQHDFQLTTVEWNTLFFALHQVLGFVADVKGQYYAAYDDVPTSGTA